ncbi:hypothetical protein RHS01_10594 [Rhizoctonia solani]|uniref:Uncharacterized protein n=1 Tax=Rhizoctonia solani TaxID=456999 RepID=A0A8H7I1F7_9AGAM|nr:hypothetical protein RHS01_10594 [Rhizoctonia solani]
MSFTPQRAGPSKGAFSTPAGKSVSTPTGAGKSMSTPTSQSIWSSASPQTIAPARASSASCLRRRKSRDGQSTLSRGHRGGRQEEPSDLGLSEPLARMGRSSLPAPFELSDPRRRTRRDCAPRDRQTGHQSQCPYYPASPVLPSPGPGPLGLITYGGRPRIPRFNAPGLDLRLTRDPGVWSYLIWRFGLPIQLFAPIAVQLFLDFCRSMLLSRLLRNPPMAYLQPSKLEPCAAAYCACVAVWIVGIIIVYELVYSFWRRWRVTPGHHSPLPLHPGRHYASLASYDVFCFFRSVQRAEIDYVPEDEHPLDREGAKGRAGNRSRDMLSSRFGASAEMLSAHRRSDSGGELLQIASPAAESSGIDKEGVRGEGIRRRSVGRAAGEDLAGIQPKHTRSPSDMTQSQTHTRSQAPKPGSKNSYTDPATHRATPTNAPSRTAHPKNARPRTPNPSTVDRSRGPLPTDAACPAARAPKSNAHSTSPPSSPAASSRGHRTNRAELWYAAKHRLAEFFYARTQSFPTLITLLPRAGISAAALFAFWNPPVGVGVWASSFGMARLDFGWSVDRDVRGCVGLGIGGKKKANGRKGPCSRARRARMGMARARTRTCTRRLRTMYRPTPILDPATPTPQPLAHALPGIPSEKDKGKQPAESGPPTSTPRPTMDTFGSTFGAGVVKERSSDQELALSMPGVRITPPPVAGKASRRALSVEMFEPVSGEGEGEEGQGRGQGQGKKGLVPPTTVHTTTPSTFLPFPLAPSSTATTPRTKPLVLQSPLVTAVRQREMSSSGRSAAEGSSTARGASTPRTGPSTSTLDHTTPRAATKLELESVSSREVVEEGEEEERSVTLSFEEDQNPRR